MRSRRASTHRATSRPHSPCAALLSLLLLLLASSTTPSQLSAQTPPQQPPPEALYTLHVYANLVQIPTLVLSLHLRPLPPISKDKFNISLDSGPRFHPTHVRIEGDDPIDLAILLDVSDDAYYLQPALSKSISDFVTQSLQPHDHVSIYAIDCAFIRTANDLPATESASIAQDLDDAIHFPQLHGSKKKGPHCGRSIQLWGALTTAAKSIANAPGRRILLTISTGHNHSGPNAVQWNDLRRYAVFKSITIFGMYPVLTMDNSWFHIGLSDENSLKNLCQLTGGMVLFTSPSEVSMNLKHVIDLVRGRYILEFPRPDKNLAGDHNIDVTIANTNAFVRPSGITIPLPDPALLSSPTTIPSPASPAVIGNRRILDPQQNFTH